MLRTVGWPSLVHCTSAPLPLTISLLPVLRRRRKYQPFLMNSLSSCELLTQLICITCMVSWLHNNLMFTNWSCVITLSCHRDDKDDQCNIWTHYTIFILTGIFLATSSKLYQFLLAVVQSQRLLWPRTMWLVSIIWMGVCMHVCVRGKCMYVCVGKHISGCYHI